MRKITTSTNINSSYLQTQKYFLPGLGGNRTLACQAVTRQLAADPVWLDLATQLVSYALLSELFMFT